MHHALPNFLVRYNNMRREIDQVGTTGTRLNVWHGIPSHWWGPDQIAYDGGCPTIRGLTGLPLPAFNLPIDPP